MTPCDVLKLKLITSRDAKAVKNFVREFFTENEPIHQYLFRKECKNFRYFDRTTIGDCLDEGLSYMYITEIGEIVAVGLVAHKDVKPSDKNVTPINRKVSPFFDMIGEEVKAITNLTEQDKKAHFRILSVHPDWIGNGLAKLLVEKVIVALKSHGFTHISTFCTGAYSTKLFEKFGFKNLYSMKYADYTQNGERLCLEYAQLLPLPDFEYFIQDDGHPFRFLDIDRFFDKSSFPSKFTVKCYPCGCDLSQ